MPPDHAIPPAHGERLAATVRDLALEARRVLGGPPGHEDTFALATRIAGLQDQLADRPPGHLTDWLESLRDRVEAHRRAGASPSEPAGPPSRWGREVLSPSCPGR